MARYADSMRDLQDKLSTKDAYEKKVAEQLYKDLQKSIKPSNVVSMAIEAGLEESLDSYFDVNTMKIASLDDLFSFNRVDANTLIHKSSQDLWRINKNKKGNVVITRLFSDDGEPIKG